MGEPFRVAHPDERPHAAAKTRAETRRGNRARVERGTHEDAGLVDLVAQKRVRLRLRRRRQAREARSIAHGERVRSVGHAPVLAHEMREAASQRLAIELAVVRPVDQRAQPRLGIRNAVESRGQRRDGRKVAGLVPQRLQNRGPARQPVVAIERGTRLVGADATRRDDKRPCGGIATSPRCWIGAYRFWLKWPARHVRIAV